MKKRFMAILLTLCMALLMMPAMAFADDELKVVEYGYIADGTQANEYLGVTDCGEGKIFYIKLNRAIGADKLCIDMTDSNSKVYSLLASGSTETKLYWTFENNGRQVDYVDQNRNDPANITTNPFDGGSTAKIKVSKITSGWDDTSVVPNTIPGLDSTPLLSEQEIIVTSANALSAEALNATLTDETVIQNDTEKENVKKNLEAVDVKYRDGKLNVDANLGAMTSYTRNGKEGKWFPVVITFDSTVTNANIKSSGQNGALKLDSNDIVTADLGKWGVDTTNATNSILVWLDAAKKYNKEKVFFIDSNSGNSILLEISITDNTPATTPSTGDNQNTNTDQNKGEDQKTGDDQTTNGDQKTGDGQNTADASATGNGSKSGTNVKTGDTSMPAVWFTLLISSAGAMAIIVLKMKKIKE